MCFEGHGHCCSSEGSLGASTGGVKSKTHPSQRDALMLLQQLISRGLKDRESEGGLGNWVDGDAINHNEKEEDALFFIGGRRLLDMYSLTYLLESPRRRCRLGSWKYFSSIRKK